MNQERSVSEAWKWKKTIFFIEQISIVCIFVLFGLTISPMITRKYSLAKKQRVEKSKKKS